MMMVITFDFKILSSQHKKKTALTVQKKKHFEFDHVQQ